MTFPEFDKFFDEFVEECRKMRDTKGKEYANSENRFDNFNRIAKQIGISNAQVGMVYLTKHMDSIQSYLKTGKIHSEERIRGRFIDAVTYLILMAGMCSETSPTELTQRYTLLNPIIKVTDTVTYIGPDKPMWDLKKNDTGVVSLITPEGLNSVTIDRTGVPLLLNTEDLRVGLVAT